MYRHLPHDHDRHLNSNLPHPPDLEIEMWVRRSQYVLYELHARSDFNIVKRS